MHLRFGVTLFPVLPGEQAAHGSAASAKLAASTKPSAPETAEGLQRGTFPLPARASSKCISHSGAKGEMPLWEASHSAGEKRGLSVGLQRCFAGGFLRCQPQCGTAPGSVSWGSGHGRAAQASPPACAMLKTSSSESCQRWQLENTPEKSRCQFCHWPNYSPVLRGHLQTKQR